jgi:hypothetical protein
MRPADYGDVALGVECAWPASAVRLARGSIVRMRNAAGTTVLAHDGVVWITDEEGDCFRFRRSGLALVEAFTAGGLTFSN